MPIQFANIDRNIRGESERNVNDLQRQVRELSEHLSGKTSKDDLIKKVEGWDDLRLAGTALGKAASGSPALGAFLAAPSALQVYRFDKTTAQSVYFELQMPHAWKEGTNIHPHVHWSPVDTGTGTVVWALEYSFANINDTFPAPTTITATQKGKGTAWTHQLCELGEIDGKGKTFSSMLVGRLYRNAGATEDDYNADAALLELDFHYIVNSLGSYEEYKSGK